MDGGDQSSFVPQGAMNVIDLAAIIPFYVSLLLEGLEDYEIIGKTGKIIRLVRPQFCTLVPDRCGYPLLNFSGFH